MKIIYDKQGQPDPYVIRANDKFYIYATGIAGVTCYRADRIDGEWENLGFVLETAKKSSGRRALSNRTARTICTIRR